MLFLLAALRHFTRDESLVLFRPLTQGMKMHMHFSCSVLLADLAHAPLLEHESTLDATTKCSATVCNEGPDLLDL